MFFPYRDDNPRILIPYVTYALIVVNVAIFLYQTLFLGALASHAFTLKYGLIPAYFWGGNPEAILGENKQILSQLYQVPYSRIQLEVELLPRFLGLFTSPFIHGGWMHIIGNMLFLYVFADNVEGSLGHVRFTVFYLVSALAAAFLHLLVSSSSPLPVVGASGAISGVLGGYLVRYPRNQIHVLVFIVFFITTIRLPAIVVLGYWFVVQAINGMVSLQVQASGGVAWFEHIGGFIAGFSFMAITSGGFKFRRHSYG